MVEKHAYGTGGCFCIRHLWWEIVIAIDGRKSFVANLAASGYIVRRGTADLDLGS
jgi:hypothetical protein